MVENPSRKKSSRPKGEQAHIIKDLPVQQIYHKDEACICGHYQQKMKEMGKRFIRRDAVVIPPQVYIEEHIAITYHYMIGDYPFMIYLSTSDYILEKSVLHADETVYQILRRSDGKPATSKSECG